MCSPFRHQFIKYYIPRDGSSFKTIKVQYSTNVADVIKNALIKFSLEVRIKSSVELVLSSHASASNLCAFLILKIGQKT